MIQKMTSLNLSQKKITVMFAAFMAALAAVMFAPEFAQAGAGGTAFDDVWTTLKDWTEGTLGRIIAIAMITVGIVSGIANQSLMSFAMGIGAGLGLYNAPTVVEGLMTATLENAPAITEAAIQITNGLQ